MTDNLTQRLQTYGAAWNEPDPMARAALLSDCWASDGVYCDPSALLTGAEALSTHIGGFHSQYPGARIVLTSGVDRHHDRLHFTWEMQLADGTTALSGRDFCRLDEDGRLAEVVGFFGAPPALG